MKKRLYLKFPSLEDKYNVLDFKNEFVFYNSNISGSGGLDKIDSYEEWLNKINRDTKEETCGEGRVPSTLYLVYRKRDNRLIGILQIRHFLNDILLNHGGHIGDSIRPTERGKGYSTEQIGLALKECKKLNIKNVLITCNKQNIPSAKSIQRNGGMLENEIVDKGEIIQRYWIPLEIKLRREKKWR